MPSTPPTTRPVRSISLARNALGIGIAIAIYVTMQLLLAAGVSVLDYRSTVGSFLSDVYVWTSPMFLGWLVVLVLVVPGIWLSRRIWVFPR